MNGPSECLLLGDLGYEKAAESEQELTKIETFLCGFEAVSACQSGSCR